MHILKKIFSSATGYWIHKISSMPVGADLYLDIHKKVNYGPLYTVFDVGANIGQTWEWVRSKESNARIYCFEPVSMSFDELKLKTSTDQNCVVEKLALGTEKSEKSIKLYADYPFLNSLKDDVMNPSKDAIEEIVQIDTLDRYCAEHGINKIDLLKIDTEGYELMVLEGAKKMLNNASISMIYCEVGFLKMQSRHTYFAELTEWLAEKNYHFFGLYELSLHGWKTRDYFGNALFVHNDIFKP
jgi:FkbM family methyltransferase